MIGGTNLLSKHITDKKQYTWRLKKGGMYFHKKIKIVRVKENKCKEKRRYGWYASKEKNTTWKVAEEPGHGGVYHYTRPQHLVNSARHGPGSPRCQTPPPCGG